MDEAGRIGAAVRISAGAADSAGDSAVSAGGLPEVAAPVAVGDRRSLHNEIFPMKQARYPHCVPIAVRQGRKYNLIP